MSSNTSIAKLAKRRRPFSPPAHMLPPDLPVLTETPDLSDEDVLRTALYVSWGNVLKAAELLGLPAGVLARRIESSKSLKADRDAARRLIIDAAEGKIIDRLADTEGEDQYETAKFVLTSLGKEVGWGAAAPRSPAGGFALSDGSRSLVVKWNDD
jgi:hypothetical protein